MDNYVRCAVRTCSNNSRKTGNRIRYFRFPRDDDLLTLWTVRCDRKEPWTPSASFICSSHFTVDDYMEVTPGISRLNPEAVPSRNLGYDWDFKDRNDVMEEDFTSEDDDNDDSIARALMSMSEKARSQETAMAQVVNYPIAVTNRYASTVPTTSTQSFPAQVAPRKSVPMKRPHDPNLIVVTDIRKKVKPVKKVDPTTLPSCLRIRKAGKKNSFCCVPTCSAWKGKEKSLRSGFHYLPREMCERKKWIEAIFHDRLYCKRSRFICRRHFTTDDYLDPPKSGVPARLRKGVIPTQNIPICKAEADLARKKLWLDCMRRRPEDKNLTFIEQLAREPELQDLFKKYVEDASKIDPRRAEVVPVIPKRRELKGCGEPVQGTGIKPEKKTNNNRKKSFEEMDEREKATYLALQAERKEWKNEQTKIQVLRRKLRRRQLSEERKMKLFEERLERLELRKTNPEAYHQLMAEERLMQRKEALAQKIARGGTFRVPTGSSDHIKMLAQEREELKKSDPVAYRLLLAQERTQKKVFMKKTTSVKPNQQPVQTNEPHMLHQTTQDTLEAVDEQERMKLKKNDPATYYRVLTEERAMLKRAELTNRITSAAFTENPVNFSNKIQIIAKDPEKGVKYKVIVKKIFKNKTDMKIDSVIHLANNKSKSMEIVNSIINDIDLSKAKKVKFRETEKLTKISQLRSKLGCDGQILEFGKTSEDQKETSCPSARPAVVVEPMITGEDLQADLSHDSPEEPQGLDDQPVDPTDSQYSDNEHFHDDHHSNGSSVDEENFFEDVADGCDHSYTNKTADLFQVSPSRDPFEELRDQLMTLPEDEARALVKEKMDGYKETFKKQMTKMRALLQAKKKVDRKVKFLTRSLVVSLREQYVKFYKN